MLCKCISNDVLCWIYYFLHLFYVLLTECEEGLYGSNCDQTCECQNEADCDLVTGQCHCRAGWIGALCEHACPDGHYGVNCSHVCHCLNDSPCDHVTGVCDCAPGFAGPICQSRE